MCDKYERMRRLAELHAAIEAEGAGQVELELVWVYEPRDAPTADNLDRPVFMRVQAE